MGGSNLDGIPGSDLSGNQHAVAIEAGRGQLRDLDRRQLVDDSGHGLNLTHEITQVETLNSGKFGWTRVDGKSVYRIDIKDFKG